MFYSTPTVVAFDPPYPAGVTPAVTVSEAAGGSIQWATLSNITNTGFSFRILRLGSAPTVANMSWIADLS